MKSLIGGSEATFKKLALEVVAFAEAGSVDEGTMSTEITKAATTIGGGSDPVPTFKKSPKFIPSIVALVSYILSTYGDALPVVKAVAENDEVVNDLAHCVKGLVKYSDPWCVEE